MHAWFLAPLSVSHNALSVSSPNSSVENLETEHQEGSRPSVRLVEYNSTWANKITFSKANPMAADLLVYCLEKLTDYAQFERMCHDAMALQGYPCIEPLGSFKDKGRDAIHVNHTNGKTSVFAYSVQDDWKKKLERDARKIKRHGHACNELVFLCTATYTAGERDAAKTKIRSLFGWELELYGLERLRVCLTRNRHIVHAHPQIFPPDILRGSKVFSDATPKDHVFVNFDLKDEALATWLTRRLTAEGYRVWCRSVRLLGEDAFPNDVEGAINQGSVAMVALYSRASLDNPDLALQRALAFSIGEERDREFLIAVSVEDLAGCRLDRKSEQLDFVPFKSGWAEGLTLLLKKLRQLECPKTLGDGRVVAAESFLGKDVMGGQETVYSNCLTVRDVPDHIHRFETASPVPEARIKEVQSEWAFRAISDTKFLSFSRPPNTLAAELALSPTGDEPRLERDQIDGVDTKNLVSELIRKSLYVKCLRSGLSFCPETFLYYFPFGLLERDKVWLSLPGRARTWKQVVGERSFRRGAHREHYRYHVAPSFSVRQDLGAGFTVLVRIRVRLTDTKGQVLPKRAGQSRRKKLCKNWWNDDWFNLTLGVCQFLAGEDGNILLGEDPNEQIVITGLLHNWSVPVGINESALSESSFDRSDLPLDRETDDSEPQGASDDDQEVHGG